MSWIEISLNATSEAVDWVNTLLATTAYRGDIYVTRYAEPDLQYAADRPFPSPWTFTIWIYLPNNGAARAQIEAIEALFSPLHRTGMTTLPEVAVLEEKPAVPASVESSGHRIGQRFVVLAAGAEVRSQPLIRSQPSDLPLYLGTARAFGSGLHPTTIVSLRVLERQVLPGMNALDFGSGSGILAVALAKLGASVLAIDNDSVAVAATQDTVRHNGVEDRVTVARGSLGAGSDLGHWMGGELADPVPAIEAHRRFDLIVANILARIHLALVQPFRQALRPAGLLIAAGFTTDYEAEIAAALTAAGLEPIDREQLDEWVAIAYRLRSDRTYAFAP